MEPSFTGIRPVMIEILGDGAFYLGGIALITPCLRSLPRGTKKFCKLIGGDKLQDGRKEQLPTLEFTVAEAPVLGILRFYIASHKQAGKGIDRGPAVDPFCYVGEAHFPKRCLDVRVEQAKASGHLPVLINGRNEVKVIIQRWIFAKRIPPHLLSGFVIAGVKTGFAVKV